MECHVGTKLQLANEEHEVAYADICELVRKHAGKLTAVELLAVAANMLGKLVAMQDQRTITPDDAMEIVVQNIEKGNKQVFDQLRNHKGSG